MKTPHTILYSISRDSQFSDLMHSNDKILENSAIVFQQIVDYENGKNSMNVDDINKNVSTIVDAIAKVLEIVETSRDKQIPEQFARDFGYLMSMGYDEEYARNRALKNSEACEEGVADFIKLLQNLKIELVYESSALKKVYDLENMEIMGNA